MPKKTFRFWRKVFLRAVGLPGRPKAAPPNTAKLWGRGGYHPPKGLPLGV